MLAPRELSASDALLDGLRLSAAMTRKLAVAGLPLGGGKAVFAVEAIPTGDRRRVLIERYADLVASLRGAFSNPQVAHEDTVARQRRGGEAVTSGGASPTRPATREAIWRPGSSPCTSSRR